MAPGKLVSTVGGRKVIHSHQCATAFGGVCLLVSALWGHLGDSWGYIGHQRPKVCNMVPEETMQRT